MVALTYETPAVAAKPAAKSVAKPVAKPVSAAEVQAPRKGFFARFIAAMMEARVKQAEREIRLYGRHIGE